MIGEALVVVVLILIGALVWSVIDIPESWSGVVLAIPLGVALVAVVGTVMAVVGLPLRPPLVLAISGGIAVAAAVIGNAVSAVKRIRNWLALTVVVAVALVVILADSGLVNLTADSYLYMQIGTLIGRDGTLDLVIAKDIQERVLVLPLLNSLATLGDGFYLRALVPMVALSTVGTVVWLGLVASRGHANRKVIGATLLGATLLLVTNHRFVFNTFYVNGHMLFGLWLLIVVGTLWLVAIGDRPASHLRMAVLIVPALAVLRPESSLVVLLALLPALTTPSIERRWKAALLASCGAAMVGWHWLVISAYRQIGEVPIEALGMGLIGLAAIIVAAVIARTTFTLGSATPFFALGALLLALGAFAWLEPQVLSASAEATFENLVLSEGFYGTSMVVLVVLVTTVYLVRRLDHFWILGLTVVSALPFGFLMAHLRAGDAGAYRVGPGDSLNRMLFHWLPLVVFSMIAMLRSRPFRPSIQPSSVDLTAPDQSQNAQKRKASSHIEPPS